MDAEEVLKLFDCFWFVHEFFTTKQSSSSPATDPVQKPSSPPPTDPVPEIQNENLKPQVSRLPTLLVRSLSDQPGSKTKFKSGSLSPLAPKLQTILSGKVDEVTDQMTKQEEMERPLKRVNGRRRKKGSSKSLSDLEFEELKGFMDLGFVFSEEDKDSSLISIIPGLQRYGKEGDNEETLDDSAISRPYLSEAWAALDRMKEQNSLMNWRIPAVGDEIDMKDHLRNWAHTVASTVK